MPNSKVIAMYDVRGIQDYIFRTSKMKDAIGASAIIEEIVESSMEYACDNIGGISYSLDWYDSNGAIPYEDADNDVQVLYIGGGNAFVQYSSRKLAVEISKRMSRFIIDKTYSLQLAIAIVDVTGNYKIDYQNLQDKMTKAKSETTVSKPLDAIPVVSVEKKTGYPITHRDGTSTESKLKQNAADKVRQTVSLSQKQFDNYIEGKGESSMLAVVHIDGNNMALRIRNLVKDLEDYSDAINQMRKISFHINSSYKKVMKEMETIFNKKLHQESQETNKKKEVGEASDKWWIMRVIAAGDDITYVCNAKIALATVEYFCRNISKYSMTDSTELKYRFTACAGIAYFNSHFPFNIAYHVAEECCDNAKDRAKQEDHKYRDGDIEIVGNWVDFQFCRGVQALDLDRVRTEEYITPFGENLLRRPYYLDSPELENSNGLFAQLRNKEKISYTHFQSDMKEFVLDNNNIPRSYVKEIRNTYPLGEEQINILNAFLKSRNRNTPDNYYYDFNGVKTARLYDTMEVADYYQSLEDVLKEVSDEEA